LKDINPTNDSKASGQFSSDNLLALLVVKKYNKGLVNQLKKPLVHKVFMGLNEWSKILN